MLYFFREFSDSPEWQTEKAVLAVYDDAEALIRRRTAVGVVINDNQRLPSLQTLSDWPLTIYGGTEQAFCNLSALSQKEVSEVLEIM